MTVHDFELLAEDVDAYLAEVKKRNDEAERANAEARRGAR